MLKEMRFRGEKKRFAECSTCSECRTFSSDSRYCIWKKKYLSLFNSLHFYWRLFLLNCKLSQEIEYCCWGCEVQRSKLVHKLTAILYSTSASSLSCSRYLLSFKDFKSNDLLYYFSICFWQIYLNNQLLKLFRSNLMICNQKVKW